MIQKLCGPNCIQNIVLVTTMWSKVESVQGTRREWDLLQTSEFWKPLIAQGAQSARFEDSAESALRIIQMLCNRAARPFQIQEEMVERHLLLAETEAGRHIDRQLELKERDHAQDPEDLGAFQPIPKGRRSRGAPQGVSMEEEEHQNGMRDAQNGRKMMRRRNVWGRVGNAILRAFTFRRKPSPTR